MIRRSWRTAALELAQAVRAEHHAKDDGEHCERRWRVITALQVIDELESNR